MKTTDQAVFCFDTATAISQGARDYQEDALICDFSRGAELGFVVLADGMGGHAAGDIASKIVVTEMFSELTFMRPDMLEYPSCIADMLQNAASLANDTLRKHVELHPETRGMGATLVCMVIVDDRLHWISIGDSPLYLFRDGVLRQLNEDHSMAGTIDMMVRSGALSPEDGLNHPDRNVLTSVLFGEPVAHVDCPPEPTQLRAGDTLIVASDGLQFLSDDEIGKLLRDRPFCGSGEIADALMDSLKALNDPDLDNISLSVTRIRNPHRADVHLDRVTHKQIAAAPKPSLFWKAFKSQGAGSPPQGEQHRD